MRYFDFQGQQLSKIFKGNWQLAGGHGEITQEQAIKDLMAFVDAGITAFDTGDIYTGSEVTLGQFLAVYRKKYGVEAAAKLRMHTKFVPDLNALQDLTKKDIRTVIERSLLRLGLERLPLVQFHWWDFKKGSFVEAAKHLNELREEGLIESIGVTNMDRTHLQQLIDANIPIASNQIQFSLLDPRPLHGMLDFAKEQGIAILCYGVLAGGLLASAEPIYEPDNRSHIKYKLMVGEVGEPYYRQAITRLTEIANRRQVHISTVATQFVLQTPGVSSAILGPRNTKHINELGELDHFTLEDADYKLLRTAMEELGGTDDVYSFERNIDGPHGQIMKYNLNGMRPEME